MKNLALVLTIISAFGLAACDQQNDANQPEPADMPESTQPSENVGSSTEGAVDEGETTAEEPAMGDEPMEEDAASEGATEGETGMTEGGEAPAEAEEDEAASEGEAESEAPATEQQ